MKALANKNVLSHHKDPYFIDLRAYGRWDFRVRSFHTSDSYTKIFFKSKFLYTISDKLYPRNLT